MSSSYGWISESTILPKKPRQIEDVGKASMIDLRAAVFATEEGLNRPDAGELRRHERERRKAGPLGLASNSGVAKRSAADTAEGLNEAQRIKDALARKAEQYERIVRGEADVAVLSDGLVDFELKKLQTGAADRDGAYPEFAPPPGSQYQEASRLAWERTSHEELRRGARSSEAAEEHVASVAKRRAEDAAVRHETEQGRAAASEQKGKRQRALDDRRALLRLKQEERERVRDASEGPPEPPATSAAMVLPVDPPGVFGTYLPSDVGVVGATCLPGGIGMGIGSWAPADGRALPLPPWFAPPTRGIPPAAPPPYATAAVPRAAPAQPPPSYASSWQRHAPPPPPPPPPPPRSAGAAGPQGETMSTMQMMQAMGLPAAFTSNVARQAEREAQEEAQEARVQATWARFNPYK
jgi:hypothetical protein